MKKNLISMVMMLTAVSASAQEVKVAEPEFINSYCILTSDSTFATLPKESGVIGKHENKVKKWSKWIGGAADIVGAGGMIGAATAGSVGGVINGVRVMGGAAGVANAAGTVSGLAGSSGMDIIFKGGHSSYSFKADGNNVRLLIKGENNETESALIGSDETKKAGYVQFEGHKYGNQSYLLSIPASEMEKGEYGIFYMSIITATTIPVGTFSVK